MSDLRDAKQDEQRKALDSLRSEYRVPPKKQNTGAGLSFEEGKGGLVFEQVEERQAKQNANNTSQRDEKTEEFSIPDTLSFNEKYNMPLPKEEMPRIWHTYVPRFTEASENYRVSSTPRERVRPNLKTVSLKEQTPEPKEKVNAERVIPESEVTVGKLPEEPTADESFRTVAAEAVVVNVTQNNEPPREDVFIVKKPLREDEVSVDSVRERTLADEQSDILELISPLPSPEPVEETVLPLPESDSPESDTVTLSAEEHIYYSIPDPVLPVREEHVFGEPKTERESAMLPDTKRHSAEYTNFHQRLPFKDRFLDKITSIKVRLIAAVILTVLLALFENLSIFDIDTVRFLRLESLPGALALLDLQFVLCLFALALPELVVAMRSIITGRPRTELFVIFSFVVNVLYDLLIASIAPASYPLFGFVLGISVLAVIGGGYFYQSAEFMSFKLISLAGAKNVVDRKLTRELERENLALDGAVDEYRSKTARLLRTTFVTGFFKKNKSISENANKILGELAVCLGISLTVGVIAYFVFDGMVSALSAFASVFLLATPMFTLLSHKLPYFAAERYSLTEDSTVVGEPSYADYAGVDVITFDDIEIFGDEDVALKRLKLFGDSTDFTKPLCQMAALFSVTGGPLATLFTSSLDRRIAPASSVVLETDGLHGEVEGVTVYAGSEEYMLRHNILIPSDETGKKQESSGTMKVMYAAEGNAVYAKFYIRYSFSEEFTMLLPALREAGMVPLVYTRDPNISNELLSTLTMGAGEMRVMKRYTEIDTDEEIHSGLSGGIVTLGDKTAAINMLLLSKKYVKLQKKLETAATVAMIAGGVLSAALSLFVTTNLPSFLFGLWQGAWIIGLGVLTYRTFRMPKNTDKEKNDA